MKLVLATLQQRIRDADHLPQGTARLLLAIVGALLLVEEILEEIKKLHGIKPAPLPPQPPQPPPPVET